MAEPIVAHRDFNRIIQDVSRDRLPRGAVWNMTNLIPGEIDAPLAKRGGWSYESIALSGHLAGADSVTGAIWAPFSAGSQLIALAFNEGGNTNLIQVVSSSSSTDRGQTRPARENLNFYRDHVIITSQTGSAAPHKYDGSSNSQVITGSPPSGSCSCVYKDRLVLAASSSNLNRVWFSDAGDIDGWDTTNTWIDTTGEVSGLYALRNAILVFHPTGLERIIGSTPPPGSDMFLQPVFDTGTEHAQSFAGTDQFMCFANAAGVYMTDGSTVVDLTRAGGIKDLWQSRTASASILNIAGGYFRGYYFVSLRSGVDTPVDCFAVHIDTKRWLRFTNIDAFCFARRTEGKEELYFGDIDEPRLNSLSSIFNPTSSNKNDPDGNAVGWTLETPYVPISQSKGRLKNAYVGYDLRDAGSDNPTIAASYITSPESTSYTSITNTLAETTEKAVKRLSIGKATFGVGLKLAQTVASAQTRVYDIALEGHPREGSRV